MRTLLTLSLGVFLVAAAAPSLSDEVNDKDRFDLWTGCKPLDLVVEGLDEDALDIGLQEDDIVKSVQSRLRAARIFGASEDAVLYVHVGILPRTIPSRGVYVLDFSLERLLHDQDSDLNNFATTWESGSFGIIDDGAEGILSEISKHTDEFIDEYLRVNAEACY